MHSSRKTLISGLPQTVRPQDGTRPTAHSDDAGWELAAEQRRIEVGLWV